MSVSKNKYNAELAIKPMADAIAEATGENEEQFITEVENSDTIDLSVTDGVLSAEFTGETGGGLMTGVRDITLTVDFDSAQIFPVRFPFNVSVKRVSAVSTTIVEGDAEGSLTITPNGDTAKNITMSGSDSMADSYQTVVPTVGTEITAGNPYNITVDGALTSTDPITVVVSIFYEQAESPA